MKNTITDIYARQILDSRGNPTIETVILTERGVSAKASVPSGASVGKFEALELRDSNKDYYRGKSVLKAVQNVNNCISKLLKNRNVLDSTKIDVLMIEEDNTDNKSNLGANAILSVSLAVAKCAAKTLGIPLFQYIGGIDAKRIPVPFINILNGGVHADNDLDFQEFMIVPFGFENFSEAIRAANDVFFELKKILKSSGYSTSVGDEGGFAPELETNEQAIRMVMKAIDGAGYDYNQIKIAIDAASSEFYENGYYSLISESRTLTSDEMLEYINSLITKYPIISIEDAMSEDDRLGWQKLTKTDGEKIMLVGDDLMVTNPKRIKECIQENIANTVLIKPNQIGTVTETINAVNIAKSAGYKTIISHRSGETSETFIADLAVGLNAGYIKTGSLSRSERTEKYNRLLEIESMLDNSTYSF